LVNRTVNLLLDIHLISETSSIPTKEAVAYQPAVDISTLSVGSMFQRMFEHGSEDFKVDTDSLYQSHWNSLLKLENCLTYDGRNFLVKDL